MKTFIYSSGMAKLSEQDGQPYLLNFTGFKLSSSTSIVFDQNVNTLPNTVYTGTHNEMRYVPITADQVMLQLFVSREVAQMNIGAVQLQLDSVPFCLSQVRAESFIKLYREPHVTVGSRYMYQLQLHIPQLLERIAFTNLRTNAAKFKVFSSDRTMTRWPWEEAHDNIILETHMFTNAPVALINAFNDYWACPLFAKMDDNDMFWKITGGVAGDGHKYAHQP